MEVVIGPSSLETTTLAADVVEALLIEKPAAVLGLATGSSPLALYDELVARHTAGRVSFAEVTVFALDEYVGLPPGHPERYRSVLDRVIASRVDLAPGALHCPDGDAGDVEQVCAAYEADLRSAGGVDLQILGIGADGHLGFNEPGSSLASRTRVKTLTEQTRRDNARFFGGDIDAVPRHVLTQGLGTICGARHLVLLAAGAAKARAVGRLVEGPVSARWPATVLQHHPRVTVLLDEAAAERLELADYYRETFRHKPAWQSL